MDWMYSTRSVLQLHKIVSNLEEVGKQSCLEWQNNWSSVMNQTQTFRLTIMSHYIYFIPIYMLFLYQSYLRKLPHYSYKRYLFIFFQNQAILCSKSENPIMARETHYLRSFEWLIYYLKSGGWIETLLKIDCKQVVNI